MTMPDDFEKALDRTANALRYENATEVAKRLVESGIPADVATLMIRAAELAAKLDFPRRDLWQR